MNELDLKNVKMENNDILNLLPVASRSQEYTIPDFLDTKSKTDYTRFKINKKAENPLNRKKAPPQRIHPSQANTRPYSKSSQRIKIL